MCHLLTKKGWRRLQSSEGGGGHDKRGYVPQRVVCESYDGRKLEAYALVIGVVEQRHHFACSKRYLDMIISGCEELQVEPRYVAQLRTLPHTVAPTWHKGVAVAVVLLSLPAIVVLVVWHRFFPGAQRFQRQTVMRAMMRFWWMLLWPVVPASAVLDKPVQVSIPTVEK